MRTAVLLPALVIGASLLGWVLLRDPAAPPLPAEDLSAAERAASPSADDSGRQFLETRPQVVEVATTASWEAATSKEGPLITSPALLDREVRSNSGEEWTLTGAVLLKILAREFPTIPVRFRTQADLDSFKEAAWPDPVPSQINLEPLFTSLELIGFEALEHEGAIYMRRLEGEEGR